MEIESHYNQDTTLLHKQIEAITGKRTQTATGCLKSKTGQVLMGKDHIIQRWSEYIKELYDDNRPEISIRENGEGPSILAAEVIEAIRHMKYGKAPGPDNITLEELVALGDFGVEIITKLLNDIYNSGHIPDDLMRSIFIALPKKPGTTECEEHRTISLISQITKILLRIIMKRVRNKIKTEISPEQCGFVEGKGTNNAIYILRTII